MKDFNVLYEYVIACQSMWKRLDSLISCGKFSYTISCVCRIMAITLAFQANDTGSIPVTRSRQNSKL